MTRAQASIEYLAITAIFLLLLVAVGSFIFLTLYANTAEFDSAVTERVSAIITEESATVYFGGEGSFRTIHPVLFPQGLTSFEVIPGVDDNPAQLVFTAGEQVHATSLYVPIQIISRPHDLVGGRKTLVFETVSNSTTLFVALSFGNKCPAQVKDITRDGQINEDDKAVIETCNGKHRPIMGHASLDWWDKKCWAADLNGDCGITAEDLALYDAS